MYACEVSNAGGSVTSDPAELYIPGPLAGSYQNLVLGMGPELYWPLDETSGTTDALSPAHTVIRGGRNDPFSPEIDLIYTCVRTVQSAKIAPTYTYSTQ